MPRNRTRGGRGNHSPTTRRLPRTNPESTANERHPSAEGYAEHVVQTEACIGDMEGAVARLRQGLEPRVTVKLSAIAGRPDNLTLDITTDGASDDHAHIDLTLAAVPALAAALLTAYDIAKRVGTFEPAPESAPAT